MIMILKKPFQLTNLPLKFKIIDSPVYFGIAIRKMNKVTLWQAFPGFIFKKWTLVK